jgi:hypothetical protein
MDDAVVQTGGGLTAPLAHRGSRHLAAGGLERGRSLRRVASEADLTEAAGMFSMEDTPLTAEAARSRPGSRDFTFARGISPPPLASPPPRYMSPVLTQTFASAAETIFTPSSYRSALQSTPAVTAQQHTTSESMYTAQSSTPMGTAQPWSSSMSAHTARQETVSGTAFSPTLTQHSVPQFAITGASPSHGGDEAHGQSVYATVQQTSSYGYAPTSGFTVFGTAQQTVYTAAAGELGSPLVSIEDRTIQRASMSSYNTAPPPVPSRSDRSANTSREPSPVRYQLQDKPVPSQDDDTRSAYSTAKPVTSFATSAIDEIGTEYLTARRPPTTIMATADSRFSSYHSPKSGSSNTSSYTTARPPPVSRSTTPGDHLSWRSDTQDRAETATHISEPDTDIALLADLERQSSAGSVWPGRRPVPTRFVTAEQGTNWGTARETVYATANTWSTNVTTAPEGTTE